MNSRAGFDDGGCNSVILHDRPSVESQPELTVSSPFDTAAMCNRCYGSHIGFTCPD